MQDIKLTDKKMSDHSAIPIYYRISTVYQICRRKIFNYANKDIIAAATPHGRSIALPIVLYRIYITTVGF